MYSTQVTQSQAETRKREGNWAELAFAKTSGIVTEDALLGCFPCPQYPEVFANVN